MCNGCVIYRDMFWEFFCCCCKNHQKYEIFRQIIIFLIRKCINWVVWLEIGNFFYRILSVSEKNGRKSLFSCCVLFSLHLSSILLWILSACKPYGLVQASLEAQAWLEAYFMWEILLRTHYFLQLNQYDSNDSIRK